MSVVVTAKKSEQGNEWLGKKPTRAKKAEKEEAQKEKK